MGKKSVEEKYITVPIVICHNINDFKSYIGKATVQERFFIHEPFYCFKTGFKVLKKKEGIITKMKLSHLSIEPEIDYESFYKKLFNEKTKFNNYNILKKLWEIIKAELNSIIKKI